MEKILPGLCQLSIVKNPPLDDLDDWRLDEDSEDEIPQCECLAASYSNYSEVISLAEESEMTEDEREEQAPALTRENLEKVMANIMDLPVPSGQIEIYNSDTDNANYDDNDDYGPSFIYHFNCEDTMEFFASVIKDDIDDIDSISLGQDCFIILYSDGNTAWSSGLPKHLHNKLNGRQRWLPRPEVIALGLRSSDSYYIQFEDGKASWCDLPHNLDKAIKKTNESVDLIAIGDDEEYYVWFKDGTEDWNLPLGLSNLLNGRNGTRIGNPGLAELTSISLSDEGDWVVGFSDGQWRWNSNKNDIFDEEVTKEMRTCDRVLEFQMGVNGNFVFLFEE